MQHIPLRRLPGKLKQVRNKSESLRLSNIEFRFLKKSECEETCIKTGSLSVCEQPLDGGPCQGEFPRWFYDDQTGECKNFTYGGCQGNQNRSVQKVEVSVQV